MPNSEQSYPCRLYLISPPQMDVETFAEALRDCFTGGDVGAFQLRLKNVSDAEIFQAARALLPICQEAGVAFIMNDRPDIAAEVGADGVHLGQEDLSSWPVSKTRALLGADSVIGISCHDSAHMAMEAGESGADYVAFGAFYETQSKEPEQLAKYGTPDNDMLKWWYTYTVVPCVAIGGMTPENCGSQVMAGADFIGVINGVWKHPKGAKVAVQAFNREIKSALKRRPSPELAA